MICHSLFCSISVTEVKRLKFVLQRVLEAKVEIDGAVKGAIGKGYLLLLGVSNDDTKEIADKMTELSDKVCIIAAVATLKYLHMGGRLSGAV